MGSSPTNNSPPSPAKTTSATLLAMQLPFSQRFADSAPDASDIWHRFRAWLAQERSCSRRIIFAALNGSLNSDLQEKNPIILDTPRIAWTDGAELERRWRNSSATMQDLVNMWEAREEYRVERTLYGPRASPQETTKTHRVVKRKPVPAFEGYNEHSAGAPYIVGANDNPATLQHIFQASTASLSSTSSDGDSDDDDDDQLDFVPPKVPPKFESTEEGRYSVWIVEELCEKWGWTND